MIHLKKLNLKPNKKAVLITTLSTIVILVCLIPLNFKAGLVEILQDSLGTAISFLIRGFGWAIASLINELGLGIDKLVFNVANNFNNPTILKDANLTLLRQNNLSSQLMGLYNLFVYIGATALSVIGLWVTLDFIKTADDAKHKVVLKERLKKLIISMVLLTSMPLLFDEMMIINQLIVDVFRLVIVNSGSGTAFEGLFLSDVFKKMSEAEPSNIVLACIYVISTFLNGWMVIFYMIRDLSISLLFIIAPVIAIMLPYNTDLVLKWFKEMASNIFTQAIQAFIMAIVILIASSLGQNATLYDNLFALVAFCLFIPLTATVKKLIGLEGEIGAAKSNAGMGAIVGAMALAGATYSGIKGVKNRIQDANDDIKNISAEEQLLEKSKFESNQVGGSMNGNQVNVVQRSVGGSSSTSSPSGTDGGGRGIEVDPNNRTSTNKSFAVETQGNYDDLRNGNYTATSRARELQGMKANAKKQRNKAVLGGIGGILGGALMGIGSAAYGNAFISMMAAKAGSEMGSDLGSLTGEKATELGQTTKEVLLDKLFGDGIRYDGEQNQALSSIFEGVDIKSSLSENFEKIKSNFNRNKEIINYNKYDEVGKDLAEQRATGLDKYSMNSRDYKTESEAILRRNSLERKGYFAKAHRSYARNTYDRNNDFVPETILNLPGNPKLTGNSNPTVLIGEAPKPPINPPNPSPNNMPVSWNPNVVLENVEQQDIPTKSVQEEPVKTPKKENNDYYDEMYAAWNDLSNDVLNYENNNDYISALDDIYDQVENLHIGNDYSQLI